MATKAVHQETVSSKIIERWEQVGQKLTALAEAIPESKFDYSPTKDVRTCAAVLRHVAFWNRYVADSARGKKADDQTNELSRDEFPTKAKVVNVLKRSMADATQALKENSADLSPETAAMVVTFIEHTCEHYGQLAVYARLNGIVPPASRG